MVTRNIKMVTKTALHIIRAYFCAKPTKTKSLNKSKYKRDIMQQKRVIFLVLAVVLLYTPLVFAEPAYIFKKNDQINLTIELFNDDNSPLASTASSYITVKKPNGNIIINYQSMNNLGNNLFNYIVSSNFAGDLGEYPTTINFNDSSAYGFSTFTFEITSTGKKKENNLLPIILGFIFLIIFFTIAAVYFNQNFALRFLTTALALIELIYMVGVIFIYESGGILIGLLKTNFYVMALICFGVGIIMLFVHSLRIASPTDDLSDEEIEALKWNAGGKSKW